jgi:parallel beta-helix repeat protein
VILDGNRNEVSGNRASKNGDGISVGGDGNNIVGNRVSTPSPVLTAAAPDRSTGDGQPDCAKFRRARRQGRHLDR